MKKEQKTVLLGSLVKQTAEETKEFIELYYSNSDWSYIVGELIRHRINGIFFTYLTDEQKKYMYGKIRSTFRLLCNTYELCNKELLSFAQQLFEETNKANIKVAGLKGLVFNTSIYNLKTRKSNDIDVLVAEEDLAKFDEIMRKLGFIQSSDNGFTEASRKEKLIQLMNYHDLVPYVKRINLPYQETIEVDVNFHFDSKDHEITREILDEGLQWYEGNGYRIQGLKWTTHLAFLCTHFYREASNSIWTKDARDVDLYKLVDIENTFRTFTDDQMFEWLDTIRKFDLQRQCYFTLYYLNKFYPNPLYEKLMDEIKPENDDFVNQILIDGKNEYIERKVDFFEQTFDMNFGEEQ